LIFKVALSILEKLQVPDGWCSSGLIANEYTLIPLAGVLQLNGHDRFSVRDGKYFNYVQSLRHFSNTPAKGINVYSFAINPEEHQPSGTCNFSRIDNATLNINFTNDTQYNVTGLNIYAINYNVLRIMSGMGGLAYSN
jgi:hypothetical protein